MNLYCPQRVPCSEVSLYIHQNTQGIIYSGGSCDIDDNILMSDKVSHTTANDNHTQLFNQLLVIVVEASIFWPVHKSAWSCHAHCID